VDAFDSESLSTAKWALMKGVTKPVTAAKPSEADLSFLGVTAASGGAPSALVGEAGQSKSNQLVVALTGSQQSLLVAA